MTRPPRSRSDFPRLRRFRWPTQVIFPESRYPLSLRERIATYIYPIWWAPIVVTLVGLAAWKVVDLFA